MSTIDVSKTERITVKGPRYFGTRFGVMVVAERAEPFPPGTVGASNGWTNHVVVERIFVAGTERYDADSTNRIGTKGAFEDVPPSAADITAAVERARSAFGPKADK
jgi:hypothetical protein